MKIMQGERVPIKSWCNNPESGAIDQAARLSALPFIFKQVNLMPDTHQGYGMPIGGVIATNGVVIPNCVGVDIGCFSGDTKVSLLNGMQKSFKELVNDNKEIFVYSLDKNLQLVPGKAIPKLTRKNASLMEVVISGGEVIKCTPDHKFMLLDGSYKEAKNLKRFDSLMPLYRSYESKDGYEHIKTIQNINNYNNSEKKKEQDKLAGKRGAEFLIKYNKSKKGRNKSSEIGKKYGFGKNNHKVLFTRTLNTKEDVYCLTVENYHNFALAAGIFVHNCGMCAVKTNININNLSKELIEKIREKIIEVIPVGCNHQKEKQDESLMPANPLDIDSSTIVCREYESAIYQLGTLGGGNHFIELQKDEENILWVMIHSGSRNLGYKVAEYYNEVAYDLNSKMHSNTYLPKNKKESLAFLPVDSYEGIAYLKEMQYCVDFALANRELMMNRILDIIADELIKLNMDMECNPIVNIAHNYASLENHFGKNVIVHRKGATLAREGTIGIIPGSQGSCSYIVSGLGNPESFMSCSHGAGRAMSRAAAKDKLNLQEEIKKMEDQGIIHGIKNRNDLDEADSAYKNIDIVMEEQKDLVEILIKLKPLAVIKG